MQRQMNPFIIKIRLVLISLLSILFISQSVFSQQPTQKLDKEREYAADKILKRSRVRAQRGELSKAVQDLIIILDYYQNYGKIDETLYELGNYLVKMDLYKAGKEVYDYLIRNNLQSPMIPFAVYGLEKLFYEQGKYELAIDYFKILREKYPNANVGEGIFYYAGQSFFYQNDFENTILTLNAVEEGSEFWGFALYTKALANFKKKILMRPSPI